MFDQPPLTAKEVFGRGFVEGLAVVFVTFLFSLVSMLPSRSRFYLGRSRSLWTTALFVWPVLGTIGCVVLLFAKEEERRAAYRAGVLAAYAVFLAMVVAIWTIKSWKRKLADVDGRYYKRRASLTRKPPTWVMGPT